MRFLKCRDSCYSYYFCPLWQSVVDGEVDYMFIAFNNPFPSHSPYDIKLTVFWISFFGPMSFF